MESHLYCSAKWDCLLWQHKDTTSFTSSNQQMRQQPRHIPWTSQHIQYLIMYLWEHPVILCGQTKPLFLTTGTHPQQKLWCTIKKPVFGVRGSEGTSIKKKGTLHRLQGNPSKSFPMRAISCHDIIPLFNTLLHSRRHSRGKQEPAPYWTTQPLTGLSPPYV